MSALLMQKLRYWFAGLVFSLVALAEISRLWWSHDDDDDAPPPGAVLA